MTKDILLARIQELSKEVNESLENHNRLRTSLENATNIHNALIGRLDEATKMYNEFEKLKPEKEVVLPE